MIRLSLLALPFLIACTSDKVDLDIQNTCQDPDAPNTDAPYSIANMITLNALSWRPELLEGAGASGGGSMMGFWVTDPALSTDDADGVVYRIPWGASGDTVQEAADVKITTSYDDPHVTGTGCGKLSIGGTDPSDGDYEISQMMEPNEGGDLADLTDLGLTFDDSGSTFWNTTTIMDADGDGLSDDLVAAGRAVAGSYAGVIAVVVDAPESGDLTSEDATMIQVCKEGAGHDVAFGAMSVVPDADGSVWVTCASSDRATGYAEHHANLISAPDLLVLGVSGWSATSDPRGGLWMGAEGSGEVVYASADALPQRYTMQGFPHFGASPSVVANSAQIVLAVGAMATSDAPASAVYLYDITASTDLDVTPYNRFEPVGNVLCLGGLNTLVESYEALVLASSGWILDTHEACGIQTWAVGITD